MEASCRAAQLSHCRAGTRAQGACAVAERLRAAHIPFRAVELEKLRDQPEFWMRLHWSGAAESARSLLHGLVCCAPAWCGLALSDLHAGECGFAS